MTEKTLEPIEDFDNSNLTEEKHNQLITEYKHLVNITINLRFPNRGAFLRYHGLGLDDITQYGMIGLSDAIKVFDASKSNGKPFKNFAIDYILFSIKRKAKVDSLYKKNKSTYDLLETLSMDEKYGEIDPRTIEIAKATSINNVYEDSDLDVVVDSLEGKLPERVIYIIKERLKGNTYDEIAEDLNVSHQAVIQQMQRFHSRIVNLMRTA